MQILHFIAFSQSNRFAIEIENERVGRRLDKSGNVELLRGEQKEY